MKYAAETLPKVKGYKWQLLTQTVRYDPHRYGDDLTVDGLRSRARYCIRLGKKLWEKVLKAPGAGLFRSIEISEKGHVHVHCIYYGPEVDPSDMEDLSWKVGGGKRGGRADVKEIENTPGKIAKTTRYAAKSIPVNSHATFDEDYMSGEYSNDKLMDPELAAKWEIAAYNQRLTSCYGVFYGLEVPSVYEPKRSQNDSEIACSCGAVGRWRTAFRDRSQWFGECHWKGKSALENGRWTPYWMREAIRNKRKRERLRKKPRPKKTCNRIAYEESIY